MRRTARYAQRRLVDGARAHGMRVIGPNALGVANTAVEVSLNATLAPRLPGRGRIGFFCQSGALGIAILAGISDLGLGLSTFVSAGNRADLSGNDMLQYWQTDPDHRGRAALPGDVRQPTQVRPAGAAAGPSQAGGGREERPVQHGRTGRTGRTGRDGRAAGCGSRRGSDEARVLTQARVDEASVQALFEQAGVIRVQNLAQLFDTALLLANQPLPVGPRVAVVGNSTALGVLVTDALRDEGLVPVGPAGGRRGGGLTGGVRRRGDARRCTAEDTDALVAVYVPPVADHRWRVRAGAAHRRWTVSTNPWSARSWRWRASPTSSPCGVREGPARARLGTQLPQPRTGGGGTGQGAALCPVAGDPDRGVCTPAGESGGSGPPSWWPGGDPVALEPTSRPPSCSACYGIDVVEFRTVSSATDARQVAAEALGHPVALKGVGQRWQDPDLVGIRLDVGSPEAVERAYLELAEVTGTPRGVRPTDGGRRARPASSRSSTTRRSDRCCPSGSPASPPNSSTTGPTTWCRCPPPTRDGLIRAPRAAPLLTGWGGREPADLPALEALALRLSCMVEDLPEVRALRLDPVLAAPTLASVTSAKITLGAAPSRHDDGPRRMG